MIAAVKTLPARMKQGAAVALTALLGLASAAGQGQPLFQNFGTLNFPPADPIDAVRVENLGDINVAGFPLWDTQNTLHFINQGRMTGIPGFRFDYQPWNGVGFRYPMAGFTNSGTIVATTVDLSGGGGGGNPFQGARTGDILISATNINNFLGLLSAGRGGRVVLDGARGDVNLFNSRIRASDGADQFNFGEGSLLFVNNVPVRHINPNNVLDHYWAGRDNGGLLDLISMSFGGITGGSAYTVTNRGSFLRGEFLNVNPPVDINNLSVPGYSFFLYTNLSGVLNGNNSPRQRRMTVQAVFVQTNLPNSPEVRVFFHSQRNVANFAPGFVTIEFGINDFDEVSGQPVSRYLRFTDRGATNIGAGTFAGPVMTRNDLHLNTFRPSSYTIFRTDTSFGAFGFPETPASDFDPNLFFYFPTILDTNIGARFVTNRVPHAIAAAQFEVTPRNVPDGGITAFDYITGDSVVDQLNDATNSPGRIEISAGNLDLGNTTLRAENTISIVASNLTDLRGARFNAQHVNLRLLSPASQLVLSNTFPPAVARFNGQVSAWTGLWQVDQFVTNSAVFGITNIPNVPALFGTNDIECTFHVLVVDLNNFIADSVLGSAFLRQAPLSTNKPADLPRVNLLSSNVEFHDTNTITRELFLGGDCLLIGSNAVFTLADGLQTFTVNNAPSLTCFTNYGVFTVPQQVNLGFDRFDAGGAPLPYSNIVNGGTVLGSSLLFRSDHFENRSNLFAFGGSVFVQATTNRLNDGLISSTLNADFAGTDMVVSNTAITSGGTLRFTFSDRLTDSGATNNWTTAGGVNFTTKPLKGDLLGTRIYATAPTNLNRVIIWPADNRGDDPNGFLNNLALGELVLDGSQGSLFRFRGAGLSNAMYINTLTLTNFSTNFASALAVDPTVTLYFASANVPPDKLTNAFPGRMVWVSGGTAAGPTVTIRASLARTLTLSSSVLQSMLSSSPDFDDDGLANDIDETPLSGFTVNDVRMVNLPPLSALITWQGVGGWTYYLEYRNSLESPNWTVLKTVIPAATGTVTEIDAQPSKSHRFYRVRYVRP
jgi:hypothetical protein